MAKRTPSISHKGVARESPSYKNGQAAKPGHRYAVHRSTPGRFMPPPGPSNIIVVTPNPLPAPKDVDSQ
jgi:hypothetical protein